MKITVVGTSGSGKTTFSRKLANKLGIDHIEMDALFWQPNWVESDRSVFLKKLEPKLQRGGWVLDGNYTSSIPIRWKHVDMVIWLDYSFVRTLFQAVKRALIRSLTKEELWPGTGNRESLRQTFFSKDSMILWTIKTFGKNRARYQNLMNSPEYSRIKFIRLSSPTEAEKFLQAFRI